MNWQNNGPLMNEADELEEIKDRLESLERRVFLLEQSEEEEPDEPQ